jgi:hypothetical protein
MIALLVTSARGQSPYVQSCTGDDTSGCTANRRQSAYCDSDGNCRINSPALLFGGDEPVAERRLTEIELVDPLYLDGSPTARTLEPTFEWENPGGPLTAVAVFASYPYMVSSDVDRIDSFDGDLVRWFWTTDFAAGADDRVSFRDGQGLEVAHNGTVSFDGRTPDPLEPGIWFWAVWGWNGDGELTHESEVRPFAVGEVDLNGAECGSCGLYEAECPNRDNVDRVPMDTCVLRCASDADCFYGSTCDLSVAAALDFKYGVCRYGTDRCVRDEDCPPNRTCLPGIGVCAQFSMVPSALVGP